MDPILSLHPVVPEHDKLASQLVISSVDTSSSNENGIEQIQRNSERQSELYRLVRYQDINSVKII